MFHVTGFTELDLGDGVTGVIMSDLAVNYKAEAQMFDELAINERVDRRAGFGGIELQLNRNCARRNCGKQD